MTTYTVTTQSDLDAAVAQATDEDLIIISSSFRWLTLHSAPDLPGSRGIPPCTVEAWGSATVKARGRAKVTARGRAKVDAWDSATVEAWDSATVTAGGRAIVDAWGSATVAAGDSATVAAGGRATVKAGSHVPVQMCSGGATVEGGVVIRLDELDLSDRDTWLAYHGVSVTTDGEHAGTATLYKEVGVDQTVTCPDWIDADACGGGLHVSPRPWQAHWYTHHAEVRLLECRARVEDVHPITDPGPAKCKVPSLFVVREVDVVGRPVEDAKTANAHHSIDHGENT